MWVWMKVSAENDQFPPNFNSEKYLEDMSKLLRFDYGLKSNVFKKKKPGLKNTWWNNQRRRLTYGVDSRKSENPYQPKILDVFPKAHLPVIEALRKVVHFKLNSETIAASKRRLYKRTKLLEHFLLQQYLENGRGQREKGRGEEMGGASKDQGICIAHNDYTK